MKTIEIIGYRRANLGKNDSQKTREEGNVPCVLYGGDKQVHFHSPVILFRDLVYTNEAHFVHLNIEGEEADQLRQAISAGRYPVGTRLPTEMELCEQLGISRFTARGAVRLLLAEGLVTRRSTASRPRTLKMTRVTV